MNQLVSHTDVPAGTLFNWLCLFIVVMFFYARELRKEQRRRAR